MKSHHGGNISHHGGNIEKEKKLFSLSNSSVYLIQYSFLYVKY